MTTHSEASRERALGVDFAELERLVQRELTNPFRIVRRFRLGAIALLLVLAIVIVITEGAWLTFTVLVTTSALAAGWALYDAVKFARDPTLSVPQMIRFWLTVVLVLTVIILATGGLKSPFIVVYIPIMMIAAIAVGRLRVFFAIASVPAVLITLMAIGWQTGDLRPLYPDFLKHEIVYTVLAAGVLVVVIVNGGSLGTFMRQALDRSVRAAAEARSQALSLMFERNRELVSLSGALAHELKNPLTAIRGLSAVVSRKLPKESKEAEQMSVLMGEVERMGAILDEFLNFSRPAQGLSLDEVKPVTMIDDVVTLHEPYAGKRDISFYVTIHSDRRLRCDQRKIKQVLVNLVQNALDATPDGGQIVFSVDDGEEGTLVFSVDDTGAGLPGEVSGRLFTPGTTTKSAGSGLGLTIARAITEQHGGSLTLENRPEGGCRAQFVLPLEPTPIELREESP